MAQLPFSSAQLAAGSVVGRIVSYGVRAKYIGALMSRNGVITSIEDPDHRTIATSSFDTINASSFSQVDRVGDSTWDAQIHYSGPVTPNDVEFLNSNTPLGNVAMSGLLVQGLTGDIYEFEAVQHTEYIGQLAVARTMSHSDASTFGKALEATKSVTSNGPLNLEKALTVWQRFKAGVQEVIPAIMLGGKTIASFVSGDLPSAAKTFGTLLGNATAIFSSAPRGNQPAMSSIAYRPQGQLALMPASHQRQAVRYTSPEVHEVP